MNNEIKKHANMENADKAKFIDDIIYNIRSEHNLEWDDLHDVREICVYLAEALYKQKG